MNKNVFFMKQSAMIFASAQRIVSKLNSEMMNKLQDFSRDVLNVLCQVRRLNRGLNENSYDKTRT